jgi:hypothetical protein
MSKKKKAGHIEDLFDTSLVEQLSFFEDDHTDLGGDDGKYCVKCDRLLPLTAFSPSSGANYLRPECKQCNNELNKIRAELKAIYGEAPEDYICPICLSDAEGVKGKGNTKNGSWVLDHCHDTGNFRGFLCHRCNRGLGGFDDSVATLKRAIKYLEKSKDE